MHTIKAVEHSREYYLDLLLLSDPSREIILNYLHSGHLFALLDNDIVAGVIHLVPLKTDDSGQKTIEIKNIAVRTEMQGRGYGKELIAYAMTFCRERGYHRMIVGTGNSSIDNLAFYQKFGFRLRSVIRDFFTLHYSEPIFEHGIQCRDMIIFDLDLRTL